MKPRGERKPMPQCSVGELVRSYRLVAGSTQEDFARRTGITRSQLSMIETGERQPSADTLESIARTFSREFLRSLDAA